MTANSDSQDGKTIDTTIDTTTHITASVITEDGANTNIRHISPGTLNGTVMTRNSHLSVEPTTTTTTNDQCYSVVSLNCHGMKSSLGMVLGQMGSTCDCMFLSETWLKPCELSHIKQEMLKHNLWSYFKSSIDPEIVLEGRPYGGVGFVCKKIPGVTYVPINCDNNRVCANILKPAPMAERSNA